MGWTVRGSDPGGGEIFRTCPDRPWGPPSLLPNGYWVFPGDNLRPGRKADPLRPSSAEVKNRVGLYTSTLPKGLCGLWKGETYLYSPSTFKEEFYSSMRKIEVEYSSLTTVATYLNERCHNPEGSNMNVEMEVVYITNKMQQIHNLYC
jgi:hypothetical protein